eukprot:CAMPEP_0182904198 /NCGR_PEP_ID=MMETSP0034_2-20130328/31925_1 /TAXON_ID=156128 /ORGANISM="Nephroselmis pyriformis, Strain CCMP717" /LENGTH=116 /DNA_ID=CAMNT_0025039309 /DNA_START=298 /DNA_END=644 /DNA_ORIENTATION=+
MSEATILKAPIEGAAEVSPLYSARSAEDLAEWVAAPEVEGGDAKGAGEFVPEYLMRSAEEEEAQGAHALSGTGEQQSAAESSYQRTRSLSPFQSSGSNDLSINGDPMRREVNSDSG